MQKQSAMYLWMWLILGIWVIAIPVHAQAPALSMTVVVAPNFPSGTSLPNGRSYLIRVELRNDGAPSSPGKLADVPSVYGTATQSMGILIPYAYNFEVENNNTKRSDAALYVRSYKMGLPPNEWSVFPAGVNYAWDLDLTGLADMYKCTSTPIISVIPKPACDGGGFPGSTISYRVLFRVYDTMCAQSYNPNSMTIVDRRCVVYEKKLADLTRLWVEPDPTDGNSVAQNPVVPTYSISPSPIPAFQAAPPVGATCDGTLAFEMRHALASLGYSYPGQSYCQ